MILLRTYRELDEDFLYHSWLSGLDRSIRGVNRAVRPLIDSCVREGNVLVACSDEDPDHIIGWIAWSYLDGSPVLHYVFVKKSMRANGVGTKLVKEVFTETPVSSSFWSFWLQRYDLKRKWGLKYNAMLLPVLLSEFRDGEEAGSK